MYNHAGSSGEKDYWYYLPVICLCLYLYYTLFVRPQYKLIIKTGPWNKTYFSEQLRIRVLIQLVSFRVKFKPDSSDAKVERPRH